jgi:hypothetical protein
MDSRAEPAPGAAYSTSRTDPLKREPRGGAGSIVLNADSLARGFTGEASSQLICAVHAARLGQEEPRASDDPGACALIA